MKGIYRHPPCTWWKEKSRSFSIYKYTCFGWWFFSAWLPIITPEDFIKKKPWLGSIHLGVLKWSWATPPHLLELSLFLKSYQSSKTNCKERYSFKTCSIYLNVSGYTFHPRHPKNTYWTDKVFGRYAWGSCSRWLHQVFGRETSPKVYVDRCWLERSTPAPFTRILVTKCDQ